MTAAVHTEATFEAAIEEALLSRGWVRGSPAEYDRARALDPGLPEAIFETAAALAETGAPDRAAPLWLDLIRRDPDSPLAALARRNLQRLN